MAMLALLQSVFALDSSTRAKHLHLSHLIRGTDSEKSLSSLLCI